MTCEIQKMYFVSFLHEKNCNLTISFYDNLNFDTGFQSTHTNFFVLKQPLANIDFAFLRKTRSL